MTLIGFDTETTGLSTTEDRIFEIGLTTFESGKLIDTYGQMIDPMRELSKTTVEKTGVNQEDLVGKPHFAAVVEEILNRIRGGVIVGYNLLSFDLPILAEELGRLNLEMPEIRPIDALVFARELVKKGRHRLTDMVRHYGLTMDTAHRATADADATVRLLLAMAPDLPPELDDLLVLQKQWQEEFLARKATWRKGRDRPSRPQDSLLRQEYAASTLLKTRDGKVTLGPAYLYGKETDPIRAFLEAYMALTRNH